jgi:hypothetical protein
VIGSKPAAFSPTPAGENGDQQFLDHPLLPDDHFAQFIAEAVISFAKLACRFDIGVRA